MDADPISLVFLLRDLLCFSCTASQMMRKGGFTYFLWTLSFPRRRSRFLGGGGREGEGQLRFCGSSEIDVACKHIFGLIDDNESFIPTKYNIPNTHVR